MAEAATKLPVKKSAVPAKTATPFENLRREIDRHARGYTREDKGFTRKQAAGGDRSWVTTETTMCL